MNHKGEEKMKKLLVVVLCVLFVIAFAGCAAGVSQPSASTAPEASEAAPEASKASESASAETADGQFKVGFAIRTMDGAYYKTLADDVEKMAKEAGWECVVLNAEDDIAKETENMQTLVSMGVDLIFLDCVDPTAAVASIQLATDADIGVINLDSGVDDGTAQITTVYSDNEQNGLKVGQEFVKTFNEKNGADTAIKGILLSGNKGSSAGRV